MIDQLYSWSMLTKVIVVFILFCILLPSRIACFKEGDAGLLDKLFISFTHFTLGTIIIVHVLVFLKLYDHFSLLFCYLLWYTMIIKKRGKSWQTVVDAIVLKAIVGFMNFLEESESLNTAVKRSLVLVKEWLRDTLKRVICKGKELFLNPFYGGVPLLLILGAALIRFNHSLFKASFSHIDVYLHLIWVKQLGLNSIYQDGVYPMGLHAVLSVLGKISFIDYYWIHRFFGALTGVLLVLGVYYFTLKITKSVTASILPLVVFGLIDKFPSVMFRQTAVLPQEFGAVFILPALVFLWLYIKSSEKYYLLLYIEGLACTLFIHPYSVLYLLLWTAVMLLCSWIFLGFNRTVFNHLIIYGFITGLVTALPLVWGYLRIGYFHASSIEFVQKNISMGGAPELLTLVKGFLWPDNLFLLLLIPVCIFLLVSILLIRTPESSVMLSFICISTLVMYFLNQGATLKLIMISERARTLFFFSMILAVFYGFSIYALENILRYRCASTVNWRRIFRTMIIALCILIIFVFPPGELYEGKEEYDAAAENYLRIRNQFPNATWTIIGPYEQYSQALSYGYHYELIRFVQNFSVEEAADPAFKLPIPTPDIFVFTEKRPLDFGRAITYEDSLIELEPEGNDPFMQYYKNKDQRAILEAKILCWTETYARYHSGVSIFYEDDNMKIYHIYHKPPKMNV